MSISIEMDYYQNQEAIFSSVNVRESLPLFCFHYILLLFLPASDSKYQLSYLQGLFLSVPVLFPRLCLSPLPFVFLLIPDPFCPTPFSDLQETPYIYIHPPQGQVDASNPFLIPRKINLGLRALCVWLSLPTGQHTWLYFCTDFIAPGEKRGKHPDTESTTKDIQFLKMNRALCWRELVNLYARLVGGLEKLLQKPLPKLVFGNSMG